MSRTCSRSTLAYYLDDAPLPNIGLRIKDVARVETLLGPQGTLYGGGALGGVVRYVSNKPEFDRLKGRVSSAFFQIKDGGLSNDTDAVLNAPLGENLALRVAVSRLDDQGYTDRYAATPSYLASSPFGGELHRLTQEQTDHLIRLPLTSLSPAHHDTVTGALREAGCLT